MADYLIDIAVKPEVKAFFDPATNTISYVVKDPSSNACAYFIVMRVMIPGPVISKRLRQKQNA